MVKNVKGGSSHKSQARKFTSSGASGFESKTRFAEEYEMYAQVVALLGNNMVHVQCSDLKKRLCIIRGKFRGRHKRDNTITNGSWVLVGIRDYVSEPDIYSTTTSKSLEKCDLLEIYSEKDKERLKEFDINLFRSFIDKDKEGERVRGIDDDLTSNVKFITEGEDEYLKMCDFAENCKIKMGTGSSASGTGASGVDDDDEEEINIDDI
jgi:translation initiation factor IF-1